MNWRRHSFASLTAFEFGENLLLDKLLSVLRLLGSIQMLETVDVLAPIVSYFFNVPPSLARFLVTDTAPRNVLVFEL